MPTPPANASPQQNADWWATLSRAERKAVIARTPGWIGNLDGIPATDRSAANLNRLPQMHTQLERRLAALRKELADTPDLGANGPFPLSPGEHERLSHQVSGLE
ncbi:MAG: hypothetical protein ACRDRL_24235, partial [Sciscionella sp.]